MVIVAAPGVVMLSVTVLKYSQSLAPSVSTTPLLSTRLLEM